MNPHQTDRLRRRFIQGILLGLRPRDLHDYVTGSEDAGR